MWSAASALAQRGSVDAALRAHQVEQVAGGRAHAPQRAAADDSDTRSLPSVTLASDQPSFSSPTRFSAGSRTSVRNTSLKVWAPVISTIGRISMPGTSIGQMK